MNLLQTETFSLDGDRIIFEQKFYDQHSLDIIIPLSVLLVCCYVISKFTITIMRWMCRLHNEIWLKIDTYDLPQETKGEQIKCVESLIYHVINCKSGSRWCGRYDCRDAKLELYNFFYDEDDDESEDENKSSNENKDDGKNFEEKEKELNCTNDYKTGFFLRQENRWKRLTVKLTNLTAVLMETARAVNLGETALLADIEGLSAILPAVDDDSVAAREEISKYVKWLGPWPKMNYEKFVRFVIMLYESKNWNNPDEKMVKGLELLTNISADEIQAWFEIKRQKTHEKELEDRRNAEQNLNSHTNNLPSSGEKVSSVVPDKEEKKPIRLCESVEGNGHMRALFDFMFQSTNWKNPSYYKLKLMKTITGRNVRILRSIFSQLADDEKLLQFDEVYDDPTTTQNEGIQADDIALTAPAQSAGARKSKSSSKETTVNAKCGTSVAADERSDDKIAQASSNRVLQTSKDVTSSDCVQPQVDRTIHRHESVPSSDSAAANSIPLVKNDLNNDDNTSIEEPRTSLAEPNEFGQVFGIRAPNQRSTSGLAGNQEYSK